MKIKDWIKRIVFVLLGLIGLTIVAFIIILFAGVYVGGVIVIGGIIFILFQLISGYESEQRRKQLEQEAEQQAEQKKQKYAEFIKLVDDYIHTPNHSVQETQDAWDKYNSLLQMYGAEKDGPVFKIYFNVYPFLTKEIPNGLSDESNNAWTVFYGNLAANLWNFYYQIALTYQLSPTNQEDLLQYLVQCFRGEEETYFEHAMHWSFGDLDISTWNHQYLTLWEKGYKCRSVCATFQLAECYYKKIIVDIKDYDKAFSLYQQAAQLGDMQAVYMLGQCYENAQGTRRDYQKAGDCYMYAYSNSKNPDYSKAIDRLYDGNRWDKNKYSPDIFNCSNTPVMKKANLARLKQDMDKCLNADLDTADLSILAVSIGMISETIIKSFIECYESDYQKADPSEQIELLHNRGYFTREMFYQTTTVRRLRNRGAHNRDGEPVTLEEIKQALHYIREIVEYYEQY